MTIYGQIKDKKPQYDINREAAEILPSNQKQLIEQAKFTYSHTEKAFEKQTKTIEDQGKNQVNALKDLKYNKEKEVKAIDDKSDDGDDLSIQKKANELLAERMHKIQNTGKKIDFNNLIIILKSQILLH